MNLDLSDPETYGNGVPYEAFARLRELDPVSWRPEPDGPGYWAVTRHADVVTVLRQPAIFSSWLGSALLKDPPPEFLHKLRDSMMHRDPPEHTMLRRLVGKAFVPRRIAQLEQRIAEHARAIVDRVRGRGSCDFATDLAGELPLFVICEILGVPTEDRSRLYTFTDRMFSSDLADREGGMRDAMAAAAEMRAYGAALGRAKAAAPADDLVSDLVAAEVDGRRLTDGEFEAFFMLLFNAGADTTRSLLCFGLDILLERPALLAQLRDEPDRLPLAIEEMLRFESPVIQFRRTATRDTQLGGRDLRAGDKVVVFFPSANRDPDVFPDPDRFDPERTPNDHLSFGYGTHFCLGAPLARIESRHLLREVLTGLPGLARDGAMEISRSNFVRSIRHLPIRFEAS